MKPITNVATNVLEAFVEDLHLVRIPPWWQSPWFIVLILVGLAALGLAGRRFYSNWRARTRRGKALTLAPGEAPHLAALRRLAELREQLDQLGGYRLVIECSWVLRSYIEARFRLQVLYQTTREFLGHTQTHSALSGEQRTTLGLYLDFCDLVKFAQRGASRQEMVRLLDYAVAFVQACATAAPGGASFPPAEPLRVASSGKPCAQPAGVVETKQPSGDTAVVDAGSARSKGVS
jgi:hypothetical protein